MSVTLLLLAVLAAIGGWWLSKQRLMARPWLEEGPVQFPQTDAPSVPAAKIGLGIFMAVAGTLFALSISAYSMRMQASADWRPLPEPGILWFNTALIAASSVALQWAKISADRGWIGDVRTGIAFGGAASLAFLAGQVVAWIELKDAGYGLASNPANAFFYLFTAMHGLHLLGGLAALARTAGNAWRGTDAQQIRLSVGLCATYWHFLLLVWIALFALLLVT
jgi:cytochrome c oxidase subunit III